MLFIEFPLDLTYGETNILKYRNVDNDEWFYMYIDIETLNLLVRNFGIISTHHIPGKITSCCDNPSTSTVIRYVKYCGARIEMYAGNRTRFHLPDIEQCF